jgi:integrase
MPIKVKEMSPVEIGRLKDIGMYAVGGVAGLYLQIDSPGAASWIFRYGPAKKRRKMGLGGYPDMTIAMAREAARVAKEKYRNGIDPINERSDARIVMAEKRERDKTFEYCAEEYIRFKTPGWSSPKSAGQWTSSLTTYAYPTLGKMLVRDIKISHVKAVLEPIWYAKTDTAKKVRGRIEAVLDFAAAHDYRPKGYNPAAWGGNLETTLPSPNDIHDVEHRKGVEPEKISEFMTELRKKKSVTAKALELLILTNVRSHNVRFAAWDQFDLVNGLWTIPGKERKKIVDPNAVKKPGQHMKTKRLHRVPLSTQALALLKSLGRFASIDLLFPSPSKQTNLSDATMGKLMKEMGYDAVPHGFRSTFKGFTAEETDADVEVKRTAMAHSLGDKLDEAYWRTDVFRKRKRLMQEWADFIDNPPDYYKDNVIPINATAAA